MLNFDDKKVVGTVKKAVTESDVENIMVTAIEGGSNYWMGIDNTTPEWADKPKEEPISTWATKLLIEGKSVKFYDREQEMDSEDWILTLEKLLKGYELNCEKRPWDSDLDNSDAETADCIVQYALFGKLVFS